MTTITIKQEHSDWIIPVVVKFEGAVSAIYEDGLLSECYHEDTRFDEVTQNAGLDTEYTFNTEVCNVCGAWYDRGGEEWVA